MSGHAERTTQLRAVDLFSGSGAVTLGLKQAGFKVVAAIDIDPLACQTYKANHPEVALFSADIATLNPEALSPLVADGLDLLVVCAPCQPFSSQNRKRLSGDDRVNLLLCALPFIERLKPRAVFVENVPGLKNTSVLPRFLNELQQLGYDPTEPVEMDACDLGVPQRRNRTLLYAARSNGGMRLDFGHIPHGERKTVRDIIGNLPLPHHPSDPHGDRLHLSRSHHAITLERLRHIPKNGGSRDALPSTLRLKCHGKLKKNQFPDTYGRMAWDEVAPTITTGCTDLTRGRFAHPDQDRSITAREAARLQTFPDDYIFMGTQGQIARQIGNAVPPQMMRTLAEHMYAALASP